jgi:hypothetical protein
MSSRATTESDLVLSLSGESASVPSTADVANVARRSASVRSVGKRVVPINWAIDGFPWGVIQLLSTSRIE